MAEQLMLSAEAREIFGTRGARRYRKGGKIPAVLAHKGDPPVHILVNEREFERLSRKHVRVIQLDHPGGSDKVFIREVQYDHLDEHPIHIDFSKVAMDEMISLEVPLQLKGKPLGVTEEGGILDQYVMVLQIECLPDAIPEKIEVDVTELRKDVKLCVKDLVPPAGVRIDHDPELLLAVVQEHKAEEPAPAAAVPGPTEPEVIRKEKGEEGAEDGEAKEEKK